MSSPPQDLPTDDLLDRPWVKLLLEGLEALAWLSPMAVDLHHRDEDIDEVDTASTQSTDFGHPSDFGRAFR